MAGVVKKSSYVFRFFRFFKVILGFLRFLGFNVRTVTRDTGQKNTIKKKAYTKINSCTATCMLNVTK